MLSLEASIFRPALRLAQSDASMCTSQVVHDIMAKLPPYGTRIRKYLLCLIPPEMRARSKTITSTLNNLESLRRKLILVNAKVCQVKAGITIIDISSNRKDQNMVRDVEQQQK